MAGEPRVSAHDERASTWEIHTDLPIETVSEVMVTVFMLWAQFAMGHADIAGLHLRHPTGRYASAIRVRKEPRAVAIMADSVMAPEAMVLEHGHGPIDLKDHHQLGRVLPMHRGRAGHYGSAGYGAPIENRSARARGANIWAEPRVEGHSGFATVSRTSSTGKNWVIPPMRAYSPASHLVDLILADLADRRPGGA